MFGMSQSSSTSSRSPLPQQEYELHVPTKKDFVGLCELQDLAFEEKRGWCQPITDCRTSYQHAYEFYSQSFPDKLQHCRIIVDNGVVIGGCQLQFPGDPGDMSFCADGMRRDIHEGDTYAYVEWIACHPDHTGKGIGSVLLQWAMEYCRQMGLRTLSLQVGGSNERAIQLYERHGFVTATQPGDDCIDIYCLGPVYVYCCLGFKHHSLVYMERRLMDAPTTSEFDEDDDVENERSFKDGNKKSASDRILIKENITVRKSIGRCANHEIGNNGMERQ